MNHIDNYYLFEDFKTICSEFSEWKFYDTGNAILVTRKVNDTIIDLANIGQVDKVNGPFSFLITAHSFSEYNKTIDNLLACISMLGLTKYSCLTNFYSTNLYNDPSSLDCKRIIRKFFQTIEELITDLTEYSIKNDQSKIAFKITCLGIFDEIKTCIDKLLILHKITDYTCNDIKYINTLLNNFASIDYIITGFHLNITYTEKELYNIALSKNYSTFFRLENVDINILKEQIFNCFNIIVKAS